MSDFYFIKETTGDQFREQARGRSQAAEESFDRCDTDGFLSQWAVRKDEPATKTNQPTKGV